MEYNPILQIRDSHIRLTSTRSPGPSRLPKNAHAGGSPKVGMTSSELIATCWRRPKNIVERRRLQGWKSFTSNASLGSLDLDFKLREFRRHNWIGAGQLLDRHILGLLVREAEVAVRTDQRILCFLEMIDGLINLGNRRPVMPRGKIVILRTRVMSIFCALTCASSVLYFNELREAFRKA